MYALGKTILWGVMALFATGTGFAGVSLAAAVARNHGDTAMQFGILFCLMAFCIVATSWMLGRMPTLKQARKLMHITERAELRNAMRKAAQSPLRW